MIKLLSGWMSWKLRHRQPLGAPSFVAVILNTQRTAQISGLRIGRSLEGEKAGIEKGSEG